MLTQFAAARKIPSPAFLVPFSGLWIIVGSLLVLLGIYGDVGALMIALFVTATALFMHPYWKESDGQAKIMEQVQFSKDLALAGGALGLFVVFAALGSELGLTVSEAIFELGASTFEEDRAEEVLRRFAKRLRIAPAIVSGASSWM